MMAPVKKFFISLKKSPPVLWLRKSKYEKKFHHNKDLNLFKEIFPTFIQATQAAQRYQIRGYDNSGPAKMYQDMCNKIFPEDYPTLYWLNRLNSNISNILDFGGHVGIKRYAFDKYLPHINDVQWKLYDLPKVIAEAQILNKKLDPKKKLNISFQDEIKKEKIDLFLALGSLQYIPKEVYEILNKLNEKPKYILINLPLTKKETFVTLNHIGTTVCPYIIRNEDQFINGIINQGYDIVDKWRSPNKICEIPFYEDYSVRGYSGHLFKLINIPEIG